MTVKVCIIGNSHIACMKTAWDDMPQYHGSHACTFFGSPGAGMAELHFQDGRLHAGTDKLKRDLTFTSGGQDAIGIRDFDAFLIMGLGFHTPALDRRLSVAVLDATLRDGFSSTMTHRFAAAIRSVSQAPVFVCATPFKARAGGRLRMAPTWLEPAETSAALSRAYAAQDFRFLSQPAATLQDAWSTRAEFAAGAPRLSHREAKINARFEHEQAVHMNAEFGRLYLESFFAQLPASPGTGSGSRLPAVRQATRLARKVTPSIRGFLRRLSLRSR